MSLPRFPTFMKMPSMLRATSLAATMIATPSGLAQAFSSGSTGADLSVDVASFAEVTIPKKTNGIYNFTSVRVRQNGTLKFERNDANTPIYLLATTNVLIEGTVDVSGSWGGGFDGGKAGPGGFDGGKPGIGNSPGAGYGPGGGKPGVNSDPASGAGAGGGSHATVGASGNSTNKGSTYGTDLLMPLVGGSGGGGAPNQGGDGGGGAILIASSTRIQVTGTVRADGGVQQGWGYGSGGAIRLVAPVVAGTGRLSVSGNSLAGNGRIRIDVINRSELALNFTPFNEPGTVVVGGLMAIFPPVTPQLDIVSVGGQQIPPGNRSSVVVRLPFGAPSSQVIEVQARDFNQVLLVTVALMPDSGPPAFHNVVVDNSSLNPSQRRSVTVAFPANVITRVMAWTR